VDESVFAQVFPYFVNFSITVALLVLTLRKPFRRYVYQRHERMKDAVDAAAIAHQKALARSEAAKKALGALAAEERDLSARETNQAEQEKNEILLRSRAEAERMGQEADRLANAEREAAFDKVKDQFLGLVVQGAEKRLSQDLKKDDHQAILKRAQNSIEVGV
jgi:F0F1-type ATP synthase membrane subunit b/b'